MTENEAIERLKCMRLFMQINDKGSGNENKFLEEDYIANKLAIKALEEIQQYRAIGTVNEIKEILQIISEGQDDVDESGISTGLLHTLLEYAEYKKIGTVEECREARKREKGKKAVLNKNLNIMFCPVCERKVRINYDLHCSGCGQAIDWSE